MPVPRALEWLWRGRALRSVRARLAATEAQREARERARLALELGQQAEDPSEPFGPVADPAAARERYREAARCALAALEGSPTPAESTQPPAENTAPAENTLAAEPTEALLLQAADGDATRLARLRAQLEADAPAPPPAELARSNAELGAFAAALVAAACADETALRRLRRQRRRRVALSAALLGFGAFRAALALDGADWRTDLAAGKPWSTSSVAYRCEPAAKRCGNHFGMTIFFHTDEDPSPWITIDLQREETVSAVRVRNRTDCCSRLAVPLVVELSTDGETWREVARRNRNFRNWVPSFPPSAARWVRLRVDRRSMLHLERVSVYR